MKYALFILLAVGILVAAGCSPKVPRMHTEPLTLGILVIESIQKFVRWFNSIEI
ncbi:MAG: hypothetical protein H6546_02860 [Chitinophagales bacterium]|nr:hypothetical protein [Chitinophagales bacterium]